MGVHDVESNGMPRDATLGQIGVQLERHRLFIQGGIDVASWWLGIYLATVLRFDLSFVPSGWNRFGMATLGLAAILASTLQLLTGVLTGLYRGRFRYGSFDEVAHVVRSTAVATVAVAVINQYSPTILLPTSVALIGGFIALILMVGWRYMWRLALDKSLRPDGAHSTRVLVFGAGEGGMQVLTSMLRNPASQYLPVALLDDNSSKQNLHLMGVPVVGGRGEIRASAAKFRATMLVIAVPSAPAALLRELAELATDAQLEIAVLPPLEELFGSPIGLSDIRPITESDLLGRREIQTDLNSIAGYLTGRRVLVTGAGGSIGSELCRQLAKFGPEQLVMLDRDESALHGVQMLIEGRALLDSPNLVVCDIRDRDRLNQVFNQHHPQVVFHSAALKHLPLLEQHPTEAVKTNIIATQNLLDVAKSRGVSHFVNISTDKAAGPTSVLGFTKRISERLTASAATQAPGIFLSVRFGNVLGSRGSVLTTFKAQVDSGGPLTVTDPAVTRYFMTVEEAVQLVIQAGAIGLPGEALVLDMGEPVRIDDVARRLATAAKRPTEIVYTGLRRGEKLHEQLFGDDERDQRPNHPLISQVGVPPIAFERVIHDTAGLDGDDLTIELQKLCTAGLESETNESGPSLGDSASTGQQPSSLHE